MNLNFITQTLGLPPLSDAPVGKIITDSRTAEAGDVFVALVGENHDAHDFVAQVLAKGAYAIVSRDDCAALAGCLKVDDTLRALQTLAAAWRQQIKPFVFGITGSSGKTTVKEMLAAILRHRFGADAVLATAGNFNNHIGLPLTLLNLKPQHRYAVIEMGMNHAGELAELTRIACPDAALVNNAMRAHIGCGFNGVDDIARAKSEIYQGLAADGTALVPAEDERLPLFREAAQAWAQLSFGAETGDVHAENVRLHADSSEFDLVCGAERAAVRLPAPGWHNVRNAAAATALARCAGVDLAQTAAGLQHFANIRGRLQFKRGIGGATVIDDSYNANPDSMKAAIDVLTAQAAPRVLVMGDMGELGEDEADAMHAEVGAYAKAQGIEAAYFVGNHSAAAAEAFGADGLWFADTDPLIQVLAHDLPAGASVLVKGSRFMKMEDVAATLQAV